jgi:hypothetical protein
VKSLRVRIFDDRIVVEGHTDSYDTVQLANLTLLEVLNRVDADWPDKIEMQVEIDSCGLPAGPTTRPDPRNSCRELTG